MVDPDLAHPNMRPYPNIIGDSEFYMFKTDSHPIVLTLDSGYQTHAELSEDSFIEDTIIHFISLTHKVTVQAIPLLLDSYMLDVDELQLGAFRFIRSRQLSVLPANAGNSFRQLPALMLFIGYAVTQVLV